MLTSFGKLVRKHRIDQQLRLGEMAAAINVSAPYLSAVETGSKKVTYELVQNISNYLSLSPAEASELQASADSSQTEYRFNLKKQSDITRQAVAAFARNINTSSLDESVAKQILEILENQPES
ncbi:helix-turn-helix domain-containing protein [Microbulbifer sp. SSSA008]|uniref:helix-turn-helix domain-containing protein n=1 Tax=unclassified Microbulbifer TaxID=2619833 RepID=UPI004039A553